jgi:MerR family transcriptional regulator, redox-sensitive transcriptional activator SoxR
VSTLSIGEVARRSGFAVSAIRYYEQRGLLPQPERESGRRRYDESALARLAAIDVARRAGFTLDEIRLLFGDMSGRTPPSRRWAAMADRKIAEVESRIAELESMRALLERGRECGCVTLADCELLEPAL